MVGTRNMLGLAIDDTGVIAAELHVRAGRAEIRRAGEFLWGEEFTPDNARELGLRFRRFLWEQGFSSRRAVVGLPAKWVLVKEIVAPPAGPDALAGVLSIQAERAFSLNAAELVFDYCGTANASDKSPVLLLAARRQVVSQVRDLAGAAGLQIQSVTVTALACSRTSYAAGPAYQCGLYTRPTYCEFWSQVQGMPRSIRHVPIVQDGAPQDYAELLGSAIERLILLSPGDNRSQPRRITAYDACALSDSAVDRLNTRLGPGTTVHDGWAELLSKGLALPERPEGARSIAAAAVALTAVETGGAVVDFLNPRIGRRRTPGRRRAVAWATFVGMACVVALGAVAADWHGDKVAVAAYTAQLQQMGDDITAAREIVERVSYAGSWTAREPRCLDCLRELTLAFPEEPSVWVKSLRLNEDGAGLLNGKARSERSFYEVLDKIRQNEVFSEVQMVHIRDAGQNSREKEFAVKFKFRDAK